MLMPWLQSGSVVARVIQTIILTLFIGFTSPVLAADKRQDCGQPDGFSLMQWPNTDFTQCTISLAEIRSGGPGRDGIPAIEHVMVRPVADETSLAATEPVISLSINGEARAWPL